MKKKNPLSFAHISVISFFIILLCLLLTLFIIYSFSYVEVEGIIKPIEYQIVSPEISGIIKKIYHKDGDVIKFGDLLIELQSKEYEYQLKSQIIEIEKLERLIKYQENNLQMIKNRQEFTKKIKTLNIKDNDLKHQNKVISEKDYKNNSYLYELEEVKDQNELLSLENDLDQNNMKYESLLLYINKIENQINQCKIFSKLDGIIIEDDDTIKEGRYYEAGKQIQLVYSSKNIYSEIYIPEKKIPKIEINQNVKLYVNALPYTKYKVFKGKLINFKKTTSPVIDPAKPEVFYTGKVSIDDPFFEIKDIESIQTKRLLFGMTLKAKISVGKENLLKKFLNIE